jgi:BASS family bile acid:Na+ symporter
MTAISSLAAVVTVPFYLNLSIDVFDAGDVAGDLSMAGIVARVFLITIVPLALGMWIRSRSPDRVMAVEERVKRIAMLTFIVVVIGAVAVEADRVLDNLAEVAVAALLLNVLAMSVSFSIARAARLDNRQATAIAMELGVHNATLAIAVGASVATILTIPAAVYSAFMFVTAGLFAYVMSRRNVEVRDPTAQAAV